jgi:hypothetical protein
MREAPLHPISRRHLDVLTGELGIFQHAVGSKPDPAHGHCVDDVARALEVDLLHARTLGWTSVATSARRSLRFLEDAFDEESGRFLNFRQVDGEWIGGPGSNDSLGRAMLALGETIGAAPDARLVERALVLFGRALPAAGKLTSPRAQASVVLGCAAMTRSVAVAGSEDERDATLGLASAAVMRRLATGLHVRFLDHARAGWPWLESTLTYENAVLPRALIVAGQRFGADVMLRIGLQVLDWLIDVQTAPEGHFSPIGNGWVRAVLLLGTWGTGRSSMPTTGLPVIRSRYRTEFCVSELVARSPIPSLKPHQLRSRDRRAFQNGVPERSQASEVGVAVMSAADWRSNGWNKSVALVTVL